MHISCSIGTVVRCYKGTTGVRGSALPRFNPALIAHYIRECTISTKTVDVIKEARSSRNVSFATGIPTRITLSWANSKSTGLRRKLPISCDPLLFTLFRATCCTVSHVGLVSSRGYIYTGNATNISERDGKGDSTVFIALDHKALSRPRRMLTRYSNLGTTDNNSWLHQ